MTDRPLPRSIPSAQGVDAAGVIAFLDAAGRAGLDLHSLMLVRHGHVVAEGWWSPYRAEQAQLLYSLSKSFTSTAIGLAQAEGLLALDDPVAGFFPDKAPPAGPSYLADMKVRHLLAMASGHATETWPALLEGGPDIVRTFLAIPPDHEPGSYFCYNQGCTYTLSAIITRLTGLSLTDYLRPRLFEPMGIGNIQWLQKEVGIDQGFSGLHLATEPIAKLGLLYLQNGQWEGRQLLPEAYVAEARRSHVDNSHHSDHPDWQQGYGFQFWVSRHRSYRGDGAYGQFCIIVPWAGAVIACTAQVEDMGAEIDLCWEHLLPALSGAAPVDGGGDAALATRMSNLSTPVISAHAGGPGHQVTFARAGAPAVLTEGLSALRVESHDEGTTLTAVVNGVGHRFDLRAGAWAEGELPGLLSPLAQVAVTGGWVADDEFHADIVSLSSPHRLQLRGRVADQPTFAVSWYAPPLVNAISGTSLPS